MIVIMQRIHYHDLSGYLLRGGSGEKWHHLNLPVIIDNSQPYAAQYPENTHAIPIDHGLPDGWLWPLSTTNLTAYRCSLTGAPQKPSTCRSLAGLMLKALSGQK